MGYTRQAIVLGPAGVNLARLDHMVQGQTFERNSRIPDALARSQCYLPSGLAKMLCVLKIEAVQSGRQHHTLI